MVVVVPTPGQLDDREAGGGREQNHPDDRVLGTLDLRTELQTDDDDHRAQHDRDEHMGDAREPGEPRDAPGRVAPRAPQHCQRQPVVGKDRVAEADPGRGGQQCRRCGAHARCLSACRRAVGRKRRRAELSRELRRERLPGLVEQLVEPAVQCLRLSCVALARVVLEFLAGGAESA